MVGTDRFLSLDDRDPRAEIEIDTDVLVTEQRLIDAGLTSEEARSLAAQLVHVAINTVCPCCEANKKEQE